MTQKDIQAIGVLLSYYETDLLYIRNFQNFKSGKIDQLSYCEKIPSSFYSFLIEFRVARNFQAGGVHQLLKHTYEWVNSEQQNDVDLFADELCSDLTRNKRMTSMSSKILFLNNPWEIVPMDSLARKTLNQAENFYSIYKIKLDNFKEDNKTTLNELLFSVKPFTDIAHKRFDDINNLDKILENRILDKLLWTRSK